MKPAKKKNSTACIIKINLLLFQLWIKVYTWFLIIRDWATVTSMMLPKQTVSNHPAWQIDFIDAGACNSIQGRLKYLFILLLQSCICTHTRAHMFIHTFIHTSTHVHTLTYATHIYIPYIHMHTHIIHTTYVHTHIHTNCSLISLGNKQTPVQ